MNDKQRKKNLIMFPVGTIGRDMVYNLVSNFLLTYVLFTRELTGSQLAAITAIMVGARIFDAANDPIMGNIIERTRSRWGKFKPWMTIGILTTTAVVVFIFNTRLTGWDFIIAFGIFYFMYSITYTMHDISYWGLIPALGTDADGRNQFTSRATLCAGIGGTLAGIAIPMLTTGSMALGGNTLTAYGIISVIVCFLSLFFMAFTIFGARENRDDQAETPEPFSPRQIIKIITENDQLMWISLIFLIQETAGGLILGGLGSTYVYFEFGYSGDLYALFTTVGVSATAFLMIFYPMISRRIKRDKLMLILQLISLAGYVLMLVTGLIMPATMAKFWAVTIGYMLGSFGMYGFYLIMMISILNTVEYNEWKKGRREEAVIASMRPFLTKMASALIVVITTVTYSLTHVTDFTNKISALETKASTGAITETEKMQAIDQVIAGTSSGQTNGLLICMTVFSLGLMLAAFFLYRRHYKLDEETYEKICKEIEARKNKE